ncbi:MAG: DUF2807 domain-containing protein [Defluviitaleaceae bacterium]|nr:DUF2807 domain-containing protein [Defluviitaleaceae bacterium]
MRGSNNYRKHGRGPVPELRNFGARLVELRKSRGWTQDDVAQKLFVSPQAVSKWENESSYPEITLLPRIANIFEVGVDYLFGANEPGFEFPEKHNGMSLVFSRGNAAVYSDKQYVSCEDGVVKFGDGSEADLNTQTVKHIGGGRIELRYADEDFDEDGYGGGIAGIVAGAMDLAKSVTNAVNGAVNGYRPDSGDEDYNGKRFTFAQRFTGLSINADYSGSYSVKMSERGETVVRAEGDKHALEGFTARDENGVLTCRAENRRGGWNMNLDVDIEMARGEYETLAFSVNGSADIDCGVPAREGKFTINGSGDIEMKANVTDARVNINGSGDIDLEDVSGALAVVINGSGDVSCGKTGSAELTVHGSGDIELERVDGNFWAEITGSGDVDVKGGEVENFAVVIRGSGEIKATNVTAQNADIFVDSDGEVTLGRVVLESKVRAGKNAEVNILRRG